MRSEIARLAVALAAFAAMLAFAAGEADPVAGAESAYLARLAVAVLLAVAALAPAPAAELGLGAVLAAAAVWALPPGPGRGAALGLLLAAALAMAAGRRLAQSLPGLPLALTVPLCFGVQVLLRGDLLLALQPDPRPLAVLLAMPAAAAVALSWLSRRHGGAQALVAGAAAATLGPGWNVPATLALLALAAGDLLAGARLPSWGGHRDRWARAAALLVLVAPLAWQQRAGLVIVIAGLALWRPMAAVPAALVATTLASLFPIAPEEVAFRWYLWLPLLLPAVVLPRRDRLPALATGLLLASACRAVPGEAALAAPLALTALCLRAEGPAAALQRLWAGAVLAGTAFFAAYPWLRERPAEDLLSLLGPLPAVAAVAAAVVLVLAGGLALAARGRAAPVLGRGAGSPRPATLGAALLLLAFLLRLPDPGARLLAGSRAVVLDARHPAWQVDLPPRVVASVVVETSLANGAGLPRGTPVAILRLAGADGRAAAWSLRAGLDTAEWAARRPDVVEAARKAGSAAPPAWASWVAGDFFGQRYRGCFDLPGPGKFARLRIERAPGLPAELGVAVHQVELR